MHYARNLGIHPKTDKHVEMGSISMKHRSILFLSFKSIHAWKHQPTPKSKYWICVWSTSVRVFQYNSINHSFWFEELSTTTCTQCTLFRWACVDDTGYLQAIIYDLWKLYRLIPSGHCRADMLDTSIRNGCMIDTSRHIRTR